MKGEYYKYFLKSVRGGIRFVRLTYRSTDCRVLMLVCFLFSTLPMIISASSQGFFYSPRQPWHLGQSISALVDNLLPSQILLTPALRQAQPGLWPCTRQATDKHTRIQQGSTKREEQGPEYEFWWGKRWMGPRLSSQRSPPVDRYSRIAEVREELSLAQIGEKWPHIPHSSSKGDLPNYTWTEGLFGGQKRGGVTS